MSVQRAPWPSSVNADGASARLIASYSAEPWAQASATLVRQRAASSERWPERRAISTAPITMTRPPSRIQSHSSEEPDSPGEPDPFAAGECEGAEADASGDAGAVVGFGAFALGENEGAETLLLGDKLDTAFLMLLPWLHPATRSPTARIAAASASLLVGVFIAVLARMPGEVPAVPGHRLAGPARRVRRTGTRCGS